MTAFFYQQTIDVTTQIHSVPASVSEIVESSINEKSKTETPEGPEDQY